MSLFNRIPIYSSQRDDQIYDPDYKVKFDVIGRSIRWHWPANESLTSDRRFRVRVGEVQRNFWRFTSQNLKASIHRRVSDWTLPVWRSTLGEIWVGPISYRVTSLFFTLIPLRLSRTGFLVEPRALRWNNESYSLVRCHLGTECVGGTLQTLEAFRTRGWTDWREGLPRGFWKLPKPHPRWELESERLESE